MQIPTRVPLTISAALALLISVPASPAWAGAWTVPKNRWYVEYFWRYFGSKHTFDDSGDSSRRPNTAVFRDIRNELKLEYGLTDWWNLLASVPYISSHYRDDNIDLLRTGVGDISLRSKFRFWNRPVILRNHPLVASAQFGVKIPDAYDVNQDPLGDGQWDFESRLLVSQAWTFRTPSWSTCCGGGLARRGTPPERVDVADADHGPAPTRDEALRDAVILAELVRRGDALYEAGRTAEAVPWLQAALETNPDHYATLRLVLNHAAKMMARAQAEADGGLMLAASEWVEPVAGDAGGGAAADLSGHDGVAFINLESGFTAREDNPANEVPLFAEFGITPIKRLMLIGSLDAVVSERATGEDIENYAKWGVRAVYNLFGDGFASIFRTTGGPTVNVEVGYNDIFEGRNTADAFEVFAKLGIFF